MISDKVKKVLKKQHYEIVGDHSAVQVCRWTKNSLREQGVCYKEKFYGIKSHLCCQISPWLVCQNKCIHCWRAIELTQGDKLGKNINSPKEIIDGCIQAQRKLLTGFKGNEKVNQKKYKASQEPMQFAISLSGEPTLYEPIGDLIKELRKRGKTSFVVTNGLYPKKIEELARKKQLPTQIYVSVNSPNKKLYDKFHRSSINGAWKKLNQTLKIFPKIKNKTRTVVRINLIKDLNMIEPGKYADLIKKASPMFVEIKGYISVGFARKRLGYERMPRHEEIKEFSEKIIQELKKKKVKMKILDEKPVSKVLVLGESKKDLKIKKNQI